MIAKVDRLRRDARARRSSALRQALRETVLLGAMTNTAFLERVLGHPAFAAGDTHTGFLDEHAEALAGRRARRETRALLHRRGGAGAARASTAGTRARSRSPAWGRGGR